MVSSKLARTKKRKEKGGGRRGERQIKNNIKGILVRVLYNLAILQKS